MTGNECRNLRASTIKRHAHSADHKQYFVGMTGPFSVFKVCLMRKERAIQSYNTELQIPKLTDV